MAAKVILTFCASALFVQAALSQCIGRISAGFGPYRAGLAYDGLALDGLAFDGLAYDGLGYGAWNGRLGCGAIAPAVDIAAASSLNAAHGGGLPVSSASAMAPTGLSVASDNAYEGAVAVAGNLPFLGTVAMEGVFPTAGAGAVAYGCGDGAVGITAEGPIGAAYAPAAIAPVAAIAPAAAIAPGLAPYGLGYKGLAGRGCGCGAPYVY